MRLPPHRQQTTASRLLLSLATALGQVRSAGHPMLCSQPATPPGVATSAQHRPRPLVGRRVSLLRVGSLTQVRVGDQALGTTLRGRGRGTRARARRGTRGPSRFSSTEASVLLVLTSLSLSPRKLGQCIRFGIGVYGGINGYLAATGARQGIHRVGLLLSFLRYPVSGSSFLLSRFMGLRRASSRPLSYLTYNTHQSLL